MRHLILIIQAKKSAGVMFFTALSCLLSSCLSAPPRVPGIGASVPWSALPGWQEDRLAQTWPALLNSCRKMPARDARWQALCADAALYPDPDDVTARAFFETRFVAHEVVADNAAGDGLITGYYEPLLHGSLVKTGRFRHPLFGRPDDLVTVELGELYPELKGKRLRGRLTGQRVVPYYSRAEIGKGKRPPSQDSVIAWVDDPVALFFLEIQGSGRLQLPDGRILPVSYADQNGHPYVAIGRTLVESGALKLEEATMPAIRAWLAAHPDQAQTVLNSNPSYVFFTLRETDSSGPMGALNVPLVPERSIAVDPSFIPLGSPVWLDTALPGSEPRPYRRLEFAQDTGGAIRGPVRADLFLGFGETAERLAGAMRQRGKLYVLLPSARQTNY